MSGVLGIHAHFHHLILKDLFRRNPPGQKKKKFGPWRAGVRGEEGGVIVWCVIKCIFPSLYR